MAARKHEPGAFFCDNCGREVPDSEVRHLRFVHHLADRLEAGEEVPAGEHEPCGAFVYLPKPDPERGQCSDCDGRGWVLIESSAPGAPIADPRNPSDRATCNTCKGSGVQP